MNDEKLTWIIDHLTTCLAAIQVERRHDFDLKAQTFKINAPAGMLFLKVSDAFLSDNRLADIAAKFRRWNVAGFLLTNPEHKVLIT